MTLIRFTLIALSALPILSVLLLGYQLFRNGQGTVGKPTIVSFLFYPAKIIAGLVFVFLFFACVKVDFFVRFPWLIQNEIPPVQKLMSLVFLIPGNLFLIPAFYAMSIFTRAGLPVRPHILKTEGIYRISRNPMYFSFWFFSSSAFLLIPSLLLALLVIFCLITHHFIILNEEKFLENSFGDPYRSYKSRVARYL